MLTTVDPGRPATLSITPLPARRRRSRAVTTTTPVHDPGTVGFADWIAAVGARVAELGLAAATNELDELAAMARRAGVAIVAADVLADVTEPEAARYRAFAHVAAALVALPAFAAAVA